MEVEIADTEIEIAELDIAVVEPEVNMAENCTFRQLAAPDLTQQPHYINCPDLNANATLS